MEKEYALSTIFRSVYSKVRKGIRNKDLIRITNVNLLEETLRSYIIKVMGYRHDYTQYYTQVSKYFENIFINYPYVSTFDDLINSINEYGDKFVQDIESKYFVSIFIDAMKKIYSDDFTGTFISHKSKRYIIGKDNKNNEEPMPSIVINDIEQLNNTLQELIECYRNSNHNYGILLNTYDEQYGISEFFKWIIKNATTQDLNDINKYFRKYISYIQDETFSEYSKPTYLGEFNNDELYMKIGSSDVAFETPYFFMLIQKNNGLRLPCVRFGIDNTSGEKIANILAIQSAKGNGLKDIEFNEYIKKMLPKSKYFRIYNPSHLISLVLTIGFLKSHGINKITVADYLPFRYQRFVQEKNMSEEELESYQSRLTDKNINSYMRLMEFTDGLEIISYPEQDKPFIIQINDGIHFENEFLQSLLDLGMSLYNINKQTM